MREAKKSAAGRRNRAEQHCQDGTGAVDQEPVGLGHRDNAGVTRDLIRRRGLLPAVLLPFG
jgi:hypothetical protein